MLRLPQWGIEEKQFSTEAQRREEESTSESALIGPRVILETDQLPSIRRRRLGAMTMMRREEFGTTPEGQAIQLYFLTNKNGVEAAITNYGAILVSLKVPDRAGQFADVVLGYDRLDHYVADQRFFGGTIGRCANRIANGKFTLDGVVYNLARNRAENHLHGGNRGFHKVVWEASEVSVTDDQALQLKYSSPDGEEGYPGNLAVQVTYTLTNEDKLQIEYAATTDKSTIVNLTNHSYFNLAGEGIGNIVSHRLMLSAEHFTPVDPNLIPTGELRRVAGTPFDFTQAEPIGARLNGDDEQLQFASGYDHNFVLRDDKVDAVMLAASVHEPTTGRNVEVWTTEPGIQFYSGNFLDGSIRGKGGKVYGHRSGFCLETQHFPNSPNEPRFPSTVLRPGERFQSKTIYAFSAK
jgi:aldose 1-epimerase